MLQDVVGIEVVGDGDAQRGHPAHRDVDNDRLIATALEGRVHGRGPTL